jgi:hypothetical protein
MLGDPGLLPALIELRAWWDVDVVLLEEAIRRCDPAAPTVDLVPYDDYEDYLRHHLWTAKRK